MDRFRLLLMMGIFRLLLLSEGASSQITDDFADYNLTSDPEWFGDLGEFKVNDLGELQLNATEAGESMIYTRFSLAEGENPLEIWWRLDIRLAFSPSGNNYFRYYLWFSDPNPDSPDFQAYYLHIGETGSQDGVDLYYQNAAGSILIIDGLPGLCSSSDNSHYLLVKWISASGWSIQASANQSDWLNEQGYGTHNWQPADGFLGLQCAYTSSNLTRFYADNVYAGRPISDTSLPTILEHNIELPGIVRIKLSEVPDSISAANSANFRIIKLFPVEVEQTFSLNYDSKQSRNIELILDSEWQSDIAYHLEIKGLRDTSGNLMADTTLDIFYHRPDRFDVVFTEIMADPTPVIELPDAEYLELYNRTSAVIELKNWQLVTGTSTKFLPEYLLRPKEYLILTSGSRCSSFGPFVNCIEVLGSNQLTNSSGQLVLYDSAMTLVSFCEYDVTWHSSSFHAEGGFSLEKTDPENFCDGKENWTSSSSAAGGTPGFANQWADSNPDIQAPQMLRAYWIDTLSFGLVMSESIPDLNQSNHLIFLNDTIACYCEAFDPVYRVFKLWPEIPLDPQLCYIITSVNFYDCNDNMALLHNPKICKPSTVETGDVVINEILFNPLDDDPDFVELLNVSDKVLDLSHLVLASKDSITQKLENIKSLCASGYLLFPEEYIVLTSNAEKITKRYPTYKAEAFIQPGISLPSLANESGNLAVCDMSMKTIDYIEYTESQHFPLLNTFEGVSLEKINPFVRNSLAENWHSASETIGWGSPGVKNSQYNVNPVSEHTFSLEYEYFTPNQDGDKDLLVINYHLSANAYLLNLKIVNQKGLLVKKLVDYTLAGASGCIYWDGVADNGFMAPMGVYFVFIDYFHPNGSGGRDRLDFVLSGLQP